MSGVEGREGEAEADENFAPQLPPGARRQLVLPCGSDPEPGTPGDAGDPVPIELGGTSLNTSQDRLALVMVGMPACGKTQIAHRLARYLEFFHSLPVQVFNVGSIRREDVGARLPAEFFNEDNEEGRRQRIACREKCMQETKRYLGHDGGAHFAGRVAIYDATNATKERRKWCLNQLKPLGVKVMFIESICNDPRLIECNILEVKLRTPDYRGVDPAEAVRDFRERREHYRKVYEELDSDGSERDLCYVKILDLQRYTVHNVRSYLPGRIVQFLLHAHITPRWVFLTRNGQCEYDALGRIGGDSDLTELGTEFALGLGRFAETQICRDPATGQAVHARLWTSTLRRARATAAFITHPLVTAADGKLDMQMRPKALTNLDDIYAGVCDGMTRAEMRSRYPQEEKRREERPMDNRFPRGESYMDLVHRLEPIAHEFERHQEPLLVISHKAVLRVLYCYLTGRPREQAPEIDIPLHTVIRLRLHAYGSDEDRFPLMEDGVVAEPAGMTARLPDGGPREGRRPRIYTECLAAADTPAPSPAAGAGPRCCLGPAGAASGMACVALEES